MHDGVRARGIGRLDGSELKMVTIDAGGSLSAHRHAHPHLVLVLDGAGTVSDAGGAHRIGPDAVVMVASDELHSFGAATRQPLRFVCLDGARE